MQPSFSTYKSIWKISYPIIIGLVAQNIMMVIDTAFLGRVSEVTLGAAAIGGVFYLCMVMLGTGFSIGTQIMIGRRNGEKDHTSIGRVFNLGLIVLLSLAVILFFLLHLGAPLFLQYFIQSKAVLQESLVFIQFRKFGLFFGFLVLGFNALYVGITQTRILTISTFIMSFFNIVLDYVFIFGHYGFPEMGIGGAAMATNIAEFFSFGFYLFWILYKKDHLKYNLLDFRKIHLPLFISLLRLSVPVMFQYFFSFSAWFVFFFITERIGETALAASNITRSVYMLLMIPVWGLSSATNTLVSNTIGQGRQDDVIPLIKKVLLIGVIFNILLVQITLFMPDEITKLYTNNPLLIESTKPLLRVISFALIAFSIGMILFNGLSGTGKTMLALRIEIASILLYLFSAALLVYFGNGSAATVWSVEILYFSSMALFAFIALKKSKWKQHKL
ncbi:MAG: MATE family efflux transporter [Bacteroidota bacterium]